MENSNVKESINVISDHALEGVSIVSMLLVLFPRNLLNDLVLVEMKKNLEKEKSRSLLFVSFFSVLRFGFLFLLSLVSGYAIYGLVV